MKRTDGGGYNIVGGQLKPNYSVSTITSPPIVDRGHISAISKGKIFFQEKERVLYFPLFTYHACPKCGFMSTNGESFRKHIEGSCKENNKKKYGSMFIHNVKRIVKNSSQQPITGNYIGKTYVIYNADYKYACVCGATFDDTRNLHRHHSNQGGCEYANNFTLSKKCERIDNDQPQLIVTTI